MKPTRNIVKPNVGLWNVKNKLSIWNIKNDDDDLGDATFNQAKEQEKFDNAVAVGKPAYKHKTGRVIQGRGITFSDIFED